MPTAIFIPSPVRAARRRRALTSPELALATLLFALAAMAVGGAYEYHCNQARTADTARLLVALSSALQACPAAGVDATTASAADVVKALFSQPVGAALMGDVPPELLHHEGDAVRCVDAWGTPIRFISLHTVDPADRVRVQLAGGPIFESAGPDRRFGDPASGEESDNLGTDDLAIATIQ